ncbi:NrtR DNA-binding winged helix domain-containing protein [Croceicoccus marinus]|uniref:NrtR DNA-binding winged helix domain-containing protein n=1 Tax=Croceicoccus marinus TaxID=450378 RepID=UPI0039F459B7
MERACQIAPPQQDKTDAFRRKVLERAFLEDTGETRQDDGVRRPARLYALQGGVSVFDRRV